MDDGGAILGSKTGSAERRDIEMAVEESAVVGKRNQEGLRRAAAEPIIGRRPRGWEKRP